MELRDPTFRCENTLRLTQRQHKSRLHMTEENTSLCPVSDHLPPVTDNRCVSFTAENLLLSWELPVRIVGQLKLHDSG